MICYVSGDIFDRENTAIVVPVNTVGVMGAGLAKAFKHKNPHHFDQYRKLCVLGNLTVEKPHLLEFGGVYHIALATKKHWRDRSELSYIKSGIAALPSVVKDLPLDLSVSIPKLGCGLGGLDWSDVRPIIHNGLANTASDRSFFVYE